MQGGRVPWSGPFLWPIRLVPLSLSGSGAKGKIMYDTS
jgi:hypothetical protein